MEFKPSFTTIVFLFLFLAPYLTKGDDNQDHMMKNNEIIYDIDYRGPETHSSIPPPVDHTHHAKPLMNNLPSSSSKSNPNNHFGRKVKKIHE